MKNSATAANPERRGDIIDRIDAALGCQQCGRKLGRSVSDDFCGPACQQRWHAARSQPLPGRTEPLDLYSYYIGRPRGAR